MFSDFCSIVWFKGHRRKQQQTARWNQATAEDTQSALINPDWKIQKPRKYSTNLSQVFGPVVCFLRVCCERLIFQGTFIFQFPFPMLPRTEPSLLIGHCFHTFGPRSQIRTNNFKLSCLVWTPWISVWDFSGPHADELIYRVYCGTSCNGSDVEFEAWHYPAIPQRIRLVGLQTNLAAMMFVCWGGEEESLLRDRILYTHTYIHATRKANSCMYTLPRLNYTHMDTWAHA